MIVIHAKIHYISVLVHTTMTIYLYTDLTNHVLSWFPLDEQINGCHEFLAHLHPDLSHLKTLNTA